MSRPLSGLRTNPAEAVPVPTNAAEIEVAIKSRTLFVTPSGLGGIHSVMILEDLGEGRVLVQIVNPHSDFHGTTFYPKLVKLEPYR